MRSIQTLHIELVPAGSDPPSLSRVSSLNSRADAAASRDDGFQTASIGGRPGSADQPTPAAPTPRAPGAGGKERRHQIPGLRRTPYLKLLLVRCDDNETYKSTTRAEIKDWIKQSTPQTKPASNAENHDAFEWLIVHVVIPNTVAATQPRSTSAKSQEVGADGKTTTSRWRGGSSTLLEKLRSDFNASGKSAVDRVRQIRIGINDVPYDLLPRVVPAVPTGYHETAQDSENAWADLIGKFKELILSCFDTRVGQYEEDIKERDGQRGLPGWNFCTFFMLKEGLARGFESVGLVEDALVAYDELSVGLDTIIQEQAVAGSAEAHGGALLPFTEDLKAIAQESIDKVLDEESVDLQSGDNVAENADDIPISTSKKPYRDLILANNVSLFDFRCYIFARQITLLLRLGNAWSTREELLAKLKEQQELVPRGVAPVTPIPKQTDESENLLHLAEICRRALEFIPAISMIARKDLLAALAPPEESGKGAVNPIQIEVVENIVSSFAFSIAQQILAQTSTKSLPIPPSTLAIPDGHEPKASIPEPKTMMHPARASSLNTRTPQRPPPSPMGFFPARPPEDTSSGSPYLKPGLEELAARRAELYSLSRNILEERGKKRGWSGGWASVPVIVEPGAAEMQDISLDDDESPSDDQSTSKATVPVLTAGLSNELLRVALETNENFCKLYEILTDKALRHYTIAGHEHSIRANKADLAVLKYHLKEYSEASFYFFHTIPLFGETGWSLLELSMLMMYARCLKELRHLDDYVNKALRQLLCKAAAAERDRIQQRSLLRIGSTPETEYPETSSLSGVFTDLLKTSKSLEKEVKIPLSNLFCDVETDGPPVYDEGQDSFSVSLKLHSLLVDTFEVDKIGLRITSPGTGGTKEIWLQNKGTVTIKPGKNKIKLQSTAIIPGSYEVDHLRLSSSNVLLHHEREAGRPVDKTSSILQKPQIVLYHRASALDARLLATKEVRLDKNNSLDLELLSGWNDIKTCEVKIKSATGGLRLLMGESSVVGPPQPLKRVEGAFTFGAIPSKSSIRIRFPFTFEHDLLSVAVKAEVSYSTEKGDFTFEKTSSVPITLALGVNVQDVFKHDCLFSRFTVSTASSSPLFLFKSELIGSDMFESQFGTPPSHTILVFPKQPASLLYKVKRKPGSKIDPKKKQTMHLKLYYSVLQEEIEALFESSLLKELEDAGLREYSALISSKVLSRLQSSLTAYELEKAALLGELQTSFLAETNWDNQFPGLGHMEASETQSNPASHLAEFIRGWIHRHPKLAIPEPGPSTVQLSSIVIPVDVPPITIVHTADIRFQEPLLSVNPDEDREATYPTVTTNQLLPATLHLKWTRVWDTAAMGGAREQDLEFRYEITAPPDTWLLGGRRKGHFIIPAMTDADGDDEGLASTPDTEADIPLLMVPLREGWLPFPSVEIREVGDGEGNGGGIHCETDYRNLGETVHVVADRGKVTLSLDASGPGGGPLVLECERAGLVEGRVVL